MEIVDVNFNFDLIEDTIINVLDYYNAVKDDFIAGKETEISLKEAADKFSRLVDCCDTFIGIRLLYIDNKIKNNKTLSNDDIERLSNEKKYIGTRESWHQKLKISINNECEKLISGEYNPQDESEK